MSASFSKGLIVRESWELAKKHFGKAWGILGVALLLLIVPAFLVGGLEGVGKGLSKSAPLVGAALGLVAALLQLATSLFNIVVKLGYYRMFLNLTWGEPAEWELLFSQYSKLWRTLGATILYALIIVGGLILLVVPGIVWGIRYGQFMLVIVDEDLGVTAALKRSAELTQGSKWNLFLLYLIVLGFFLAGLLTVGLGLIAVIPLVVFITFKTYETLRQRHAAAALSPEAPPPAS